MLRVSYIRIYKLIANTYLVAVFFSALGIIYVGFFTSAGSIITTVGFISLGFIWFYTSLKAYGDAKKKPVSEHQNMMSYSYAACIALITLRLWMYLLVPFFTEINTVLIIVAWWSWIPNLIVAYTINRRMET